MFKPDDFLANFAKHKDFAKVSKFHVEISKPSGFAAGDVDFKDLRFQCEAAELPGYNINTVDAKIYGVPAPAASFASFNDITLTFICAGDLWEKKLFDYWMNLIVPINNYQLRYKSEYVSKINITQFYETGEPSYIVSLWNAFPITLSPLTLNWGDDGIHKLSVTFKYDYWSTNNTEKFGINQQTATSAPTRPATPAQPTNPQGAGGNSFKPGSASRTTGIIPTTTPPVRTLMERNFARYDKPGP